MNAPPALNPPVATAARKPTWRFLVSHPAHLIALGFGSGLSPLAPGTVGTLWAWVAFAVLQPHMTDAQVDRVTEPEHLEEIGRAHV